MTTLYQRARMAQGLRWKSQRPTLGELKAGAENWLRTIAIIVVIVLAYGIVGRLDYEEAQRIEAEIQRDMYLGVVLACLNKGGMVFDHEAFECKAESLGNVR